MSKIDKDKISDFKNNEVDLRELQLFLYENEAK